MPAPVVLFPYQYVHILDNSDGTIRTVEGPKRVTLKSNEVLIGDKKNFVVVGDNQYACILHPYDLQSKQCRMGDMEVRKGPCAFSLHFGEELVDGKVNDAHVLSDTQALVIELQQERDGKPAGTLWRIQGECKYIPSKHEKIVRQINAILINKNEGIYVKDVMQSKTRLIKGPSAYLLDVHEELYKKPFTADERMSLGLPATATHWASAIQLQKGEVMCVLDYEKNKETVIMGPASHILGPQEGVKVLSLSAGKPKKTNAIKVAKVRLGPDFMSDTFQIRTKDNALLSLEVTYKWQFLVHKGNAAQAFCLNDFVGYACQSLCSGIREEAARFNFEDFHNSTVQILRDALFKDHTVVLEEGGKPQAVHGYFIEDNMFLVSEVDVKKVSPVNTEIALLLSQSIKSNMEIVCKKLEEAANLAAQKEYVQGQSEIQELKKGLIGMENENYRLMTVDKATIEGKALVEKAKAQKEAAEIKEKSKLELELKKMKATIELLSTPNGRDYLELLRVQSLAGVKQSWIIPSDVTYDPITCNFNKPEPVHRPTLTEIVPK